MLLLLSAAGPAIAVYATEESTNTDTTSANESDTTIPETTEPETTEPEPTLAFQALAGAIYPGFWIRPQEHLLFPEPVFWLQKALTGKYINPN